MVEMSIAILSLISLLIAAYFIRLFLVVARSDAGTFDALNERTGSVSNALYGEVDPYRDGRRDYEVAAGLTLRKHDNTLVVNGRLSDETVERL